MMIKLYGMATCSRCKTAKMMLEKRQEALEGKGVTIEFIDLTSNDALATKELPLLIVDADSFFGKPAMLKIRELK
jgi:arsenate reductase-like glutaredoxin family protein